MAARAARGPSMPVVATDTLEALAAAVLELPAEGPLPSRTVLVRSERQAHALRLALAGRHPSPAPGEGAGTAPSGPGVLAGTRLVGPLTAAEEVLRLAGVDFTTGESTLRPVRLARLFSSGPALAHYRREHLLATPGWDQAFADAIHTLESAGLGPGDLPGEPAALRDLAALWSALEEDARGSWTAARIHAEAAALLERDPGAWPYPGAVLAPVDGHEAPALARFLRAVPGVTLALRRARPARARWVARVETGFGAEAAALARAGAPSPGRVPTELARLQALLLHAEPAEAAALLGRSAGPDGTVDLEEHAGVEEELDATAAWVTRRVLEDGVPLSRLAVLVPVLDPLGGLVADRIERLGLAAHVAGAVPAVSTSAGARVLALVRALGRRLPAADVAAVLPFLRLVEPAAGNEPARRHLSHGDALELAFSLGTAGGSTARPGGALDWKPRALERTGELERAVEAARGAAGGDEREVWRLEGTLANLRAVRGALDGLVGVALAVHEGRPLDAIATALLAFLDGSVLLPGPGGAPRVLGPLGERLDALRASTAGSELAGAGALDAIEEAVLALRLPRGRFGEPAVVVGTVASAAGLSFDAVRVIGLAEGSIPSSPREDPVLPAAARTAILGHRPGTLLRGPEDAVLAQLHAFHAAVLGARRFLALSAPRVDLARTEREPAALFVEVAAALGRPARGTSEAPPAVPDAQALRRDAFEPAREAAFAFRHEHPVSQADWLARVARRAPEAPPELPPAWRGDAALDLARLVPEGGPVRLGARDGVLAGGGPFPDLPGLVPARPISASALGDLLACPRRFLMERVLGWKEPAEAPELRELDPLRFGTLVHRVHEELYRAHGAAIVGRERDLVHWTRLARGLADRAFDASLLEFPLLGDRVREKQRERLHDAVLAFLRYDWALSGGRKLRFVDVERAFGTETPLALDVDGRRLHVRGYLDRLDAARDQAIVRDLKSGRAHPRSGDEAGPVPHLDVQLGLYQRVVRELAGEWGLPSRVVGAYAYTSGKGDVRERSFRLDPEALERATDGWLVLAGSLLAEHRFPVTPEERDCDYCPFAPLCGSEEPRRAAAGLEGSEDPTLRRFLRLKTGEEP